MQVCSLIRKGERVFDIGCATGYFAQKLRRKNCEVFGIDPDMKAIMVARKYCKKAFVGNISKLNLLSIPEDFDTVLMLDVIEHLKDQGAQLSLIKKYIKTGGKLIISTPNIAHISVRLNLLLGRFEYQEVGIMDKLHIHLFTKKTFVETINSAGYKIEKMDYSADFGQLPFYFGRLFNFVPKKLQYRITKIFNTLLAVQFIAVCRVRA